MASPLPRGAGVLTSLVRADGLLVIPTEVEGHHAGEEVDISLLRSLPEIERTIVAIGSHDPILDLAASELRSRDPGVTLASSNVGSLGGLIALRDGLCHLAGSHLLEPETGEYTLPYVDQMLRGARHRHRPARAPRAGTHRRPRQPARPRRDRRPRPAPSCATSTASGARARAYCSTTNCSAPASTRRALTGYAREEPTHLAVAAAISAGRADCGLGVQAAARAFGLDFVPVAQEPYDLVHGPGHRRLRRCWRRCGRSWRPRTFRSAVEALGGYDTARWAVASASDCAQPPPIPVLSTTSAASTGKASPSTGAKKVPSLRTAS